MHNHLNGITLSTTTFNTIDIYLDSFCRIDLSELTSFISYKPSMCVLEPTPIRLLKDVLVINASFLNMTNQ